MDSLKEVLHMVDSPSFARVSVSTYGIRLRILRSVFGSGLETGVWAER